jgi:dCMP deaminase
MYMVGREAQTGEIIKNATSCPMCKRLIINAGIDKVVIRDDDEKFRVVEVQTWVDNDDLVDMSSLGY